MKNRLKVHPTIFVIRSRDGSAVHDIHNLLETFGTKAPLGELTDFCLLKLENGSKGEKKSAEVKKTWQHLQDKLGAEFAVEPVFIGRNGRLSYATGSLSVRFRKTPTNAELKKFAHRWGLRLKARNPYVRSQAAFEKTAKTMDHYLPDMIDSIRRKEKQVRAVWPDTYSNYFKV
jgi:hypothetical protein